MKKSFSKRFDLPAVRSGLLVSILSYKFKQVFVLNTSRLPSHWLALKKVIFIIVIGCGLDLLLIIGLILQICVLSHSEPRHTTANYKDLKELTFKGQGTAREQHRDMTHFYRIIDLTINSDRILIIWLWVGCCVFGLPLVISAKKILWIDFKNTLSTLGRYKPALLLLVSELILK